MVALLQRKCSRSAMANGNISYCFVTTLATLVGLSSSDKWTSQNCMGLAV
jgi:hypothetical protein